MARRFVRICRVAFTDPILLPSIIVFATMVTLYLPGVLSPETRAVLAEEYFELPLRVLLVVALSLHMNRIRDLRERRFWYLVIAAFASWFAGDAIVNPHPDLLRQLPWALTEDAIFLAFYPLLLLALETKPHQIASRSVRSILFSPMGLAILLFFSALSIYFVLIPATLDRVTYLTTLPSYCFFAVLDAVIVFGFIVGALRANNRRWKVQYSLFGTAMLLWLVADVLDGLTIGGILDLPLGEALDFFWYAPYFVAIGCVVYRNRGIARVSSAASTGSLITGPRRDSGDIGTMLAYAVMMPTIHLTVYLPGLMPATEMQREVVAVLAACSLLALTGWELHRKRGASSDSNPHLLVFDEQLQHAQRMEALGRLAGGVAHDFNNLLMVMKGHSELLARGLEHDPERRVHVETIQSSVEHAAMLTRDLLAFSRKQTLELYPVDLNEAVRDAAKLLDRVLGADIGLSLELTPESAVVWGDRGQLVQVVLNLALNARQAMPDGGLLRLSSEIVDLQATSLDGESVLVPGRYVQLSASDTGRGMDDETRAHLFEPFFTRREEGRGTGLGLATVYGIAKQSGGHVWVESELERGSTFRICLPRLDVEIDEPVHPSFAGTGEEEASGTILIAEDGLEIRRLSFEYLQARGYRVLEAADGLEALRVSQRYAGSIDVLLTDLVMPELGGFDLAHRLSSERPGLRVLYMSGYAADPSAPGYPTDENPVILQKPFSMPELQDRIEALLTG